MSSHAQIIQYRDETMIVINKDGADTSNKSATLFLGFLVIVLSSAAHILVIICTFLVHNKSCHIVTNQTHNNSLIPMLDGLG